MQYKAVQIKAIKEATATARTADHYYEFQQQQAIRRFPTRLSDKQEIDRLKVCVTQCLAVMDRFMDFIELKQCPFTMEDPNKPESKRQPSTTITEPAIKPTDDNDNSHHSHSPYH